MKISAIEKFGLRCLLVLANQGPGQQLSISEIAEMEGLSIPYTSKILSALRQADLVKAERGRGGGFTITRPARDINMYDVLTALGGPLVEANHCADKISNNNQCNHDDKCSVHDILDTLSNHLKQFLVMTTLEDILNGNRFSTMTGFTRTDDILKYNNKANETAADNFENEKEEINK
jgi:Rrf2 family iron-sulfur cluster assembly transcriptional regulator